MSHINGDKLNITSVMNNESRNNNDHSVSYAGLNDINMNNNNISMFNVNNAQDQSLSMIIP